MCTVPSHLSVLLNLHGAQPVRLPLQELHVLEVRNSLVQVRGRAPVEVVVAHGRRLVGVVRVVLAILICGALALLALADQ